MVSESHAGKTRRLETLSGPSFEEYYFFSFLVPWCSSRCQGRGTPTKSSQSPRTAASFLSMSTTYVTRQ